MSGLWWRLVTQHKILCRVIHEKPIDSGPRRRRGYSAKADTRSPRFDGRTAKIFSKEPGLGNWFAEIVHTIQGGLICDLWLVPLVHYHHKYNKFPRFSLEKTWKKKKSKRAESA